MMMLIVLFVVTVCLVVVAGLVVWLGWPLGLLVTAGLAGVVVSSYVWIIKPWHLRWGATDDEITRTMPGDALIPDATSATRAITIKATAADVWPWLVQIGYGKAGWYSYDWIDNDFQPSADRIVPEYQHLSVGDKILMMPTMGFVVESVDPPMSIVSILEDGSTSWCLGLYGDGEGVTRLVSRWRPKFERTPANYVMTALAEPGTFIMEQKMLRTIRDRVETKEDEGI
jgi:hypothetical protein